MGQIVPHTNIPTLEVMASCTAHWELWSSIRHSRHVPDAAPSQAYDMPSSGGLARVEDGFYFPTLEDG